MKAAAAGPQLVHPGVPELASGEPHRKGLGYGWRRGSGGRRGDAGRHRRGGGLFDELRPDAALATYQAGGAQPPTAHVMLTWTLDPT